MGGQQAMAQSTESGNGALFGAGSAELSPEGQRWIDSVVAAQAQRPHRLVVVSLPGSDATLQMQRAQALRDRLSQLGVAPDQIYFEAAAN